MVQGTPGGVLRIIFLKRHTEVDKGSPTASMLRGRTSARREASRQPALSVLEFQEVMQHRFNVAFNPNRIYRVRKPDRPQAA